MADYRKLIPFILQQKGGYVNNPADKGEETNKRITWPYGFPILVIQKPAITALL